MDYKTLLEKYVSHVSQMEGTTFIGWLNSGRLSEVEFTAEEAEELRRIGTELGDDDAY
ncbi:hypothetical protein AMA2_28 [Achromobacter phage AMA2]|nr:hypothetical protein AMA2_28 [Achromobacter phage AMA2]